MFKIGVFSIIFGKQNNVLFCHRRDYDLWNLPGGGLEKGEAPWECAVREVKEETGLDVKIERLSGIYNKPEKNEIVFQYICKIIGGKITLNDEADKIEYFVFNDIPKNTCKKHTERIKDVLDHPDRLIMKTQTGKTSIEMLKKEIETHRRN